MADLNFDNLDDFAVIYDGGINTGPFYYFYFQEENGRFYRNVFLTDKMGHFPSRIDNEKQQLTTVVRSGAYGLNETTFQYNSIRKSWYLHSSRKIEF